MLFLAHYKIDWEHLETAMVKRLEWDEIKPDTFTIINEYVVNGHPDAVTGIMIFDVQNNEDISALTMFFGSTVTFDVRPCSDVKSAIQHYKSMEPQHD